MEVKHGLLIVIRVLGGENETNALIVGYRNLVVIFVTPFVCKVFGV